MRIFPERLCDAIAASIKSLAASIVLEMEEEGESVSGSLLYTTPGTFVSGVEPMLRTWVIEWDEMKAMDEADDSGPRKRLGGKMRVAASLLFVLFFGIFQVERKRNVYKTKYNNQCLCGLGFCLGGMSP